MEVGMDPVRRLFVREMTLSFFEGSNLGRNGTSNNSGEKNKLS